MLARKLPASKLHLGEGTITLSKKIASHLAQAAIDRCKALSREIKDADDPLEVVESAHVDWDTLKSLIDQTRNHAENFRLAADALDGRVVDGPPSPLIELAIVTRASYDTLDLLDPTFDTEELDETAKLLRDVANALYEDLAVLKSRATKHDFACRDLTLRAASLEQTDLDRIQEYEFPHDFEMPKRLSMTQWREQEFAKNPNAPSPRVLHEKSIRSAAKQYFGARHDAVERDRRRKKMESRKKLQSEIKELWA